ncbi:hypothetical protein Hsc_0815 [Herbaspirillum seropedicae]|nr:hypothetical protein Hsc_0815 [Herbaspirillum seropedicae]
MYFFVDESGHIQARRRGVPFAQWDGAWYQSLADVQDKLQVVFHDERLFLAGGSLTSTHVLKPEPLGERTPYLVANEHFCMSLAAAIGLSVPRVQIHRVPETVLLIERASTGHMRQAMTSCSQEESSGRTSLTHAKPWICPARGSMNISDGMTAGPLRGGTVSASRSSSGWHHISRMCPPPR